VNSWLIGQYETGNQRYKDRPQTHHRKQTHHGKQRMHMTRTKQ